MSHGPIRTFRNLLLVAAALLCSTSTVFAQSSITLAWDPSPDPAVTGYIVSWAPYGTPWYTSSRDVGNVTTYTLCCFDPSVKYQFGVQAYSTSGTSAYSNQVSNNALIIYDNAASAALPDQRPSIFWRNTVTGQVDTWLMSGATVLATRPLSIDRVSDTNWFVAATGDFNGDGSPDVLWRNSSTGALAVWMLKNNAVIATQMLSIGSVSDPNWKIVGAGDVDGDGYADIVWQHQTGGWLAVWFMRGASVATVKYLDIPKTSSNAWQIAAVADLNGDGYADLIWRDTSAGYVAAWFLKGTAVTYQAYLSQPQVANLSWKIVGAGHPGGATSPTIVWQNSSDGTVAFWYMSGTTLVGTAYTNPMQVDTPNWKIVGSR